VTDPAGGSAPGIMPGAEPFEAAPEGWGGDGGPRIGVLLCHGFTGSPQSLRPWAEYLLAEGFRVSLPLLPGHGTRWPDMQATTWQDWYGALDRALGVLLAECDQVYVTGLSMGGGLALRLAEEHGSAISGLVLVNPSVQRNKPVEALIPLISRLIPALPGVASDIKKPDTRELGYDRVPLKAAFQLTRLWATVAPDLGRVTAPVLLFHSAVDHVVHPSNSALVLSRIASTDVREVVLDESYHVATLDNDAPAIFAGSADFIRRLSGPGRPAAAAAGVGGAELGTGSGSEAGSAEAHT
jgi:carboxylesterase